MKETKLTENEQKRIKMIANEIQDYLNAIHMECMRKNSFRPYLKEKMSAITIDVKVINGILDDEENEEN